MLQNFWVGTDFDKLLTSLPVNNDAVKTLVEAQAKNLKALEQANQHAFDAFRGVFTRQSEVLHATLDEMYKALTAKPGPDALAQQAALAKAATERTLESLRQISEMVADASQKANQVLVERVQENIQELQKLGQP